MRIGNPKYEDQRGFVELSDDPAVVLPGYRMPELPAYLAEQMVEVLDVYSRNPGTITWPLDTGRLAFEEPAQAICGQGDRLLSRIVKCAIHDGEGGGLLWRVLADTSTGVALVAGSHFTVVRPR